jgi:hypothetical protein
MLLRISRVVNMMMESRYIHKKIEDLTLDDFDLDKDTVYTCRTEEVDDKGWAGVKDWIYLSSKCYIVVSNGRSGNWDKGFNKTYIPKLKSISNLVESKNY